MNNLAKNIMGEFRPALEGVYGSRLKGVYVFGSFARGEEEEGSDLDVLIVLDSIGGYSTESRKSIGLSAGLSMKYGVTISRIFMTDDAWRGGDTPFLANVREEVKDASDGKVPGIDN